MRKAHWLWWIATCWLALSCSAYAAEGVISYRARIVHNNRTGQSIAEGVINLGPGDFIEEIIESANLDWTRIPGQSLPTQPALPDIYRSGQQVASRQGGGIPSFGNPILRHFIVGEVIRSLADLEQGQTFLYDQLKIESLEVKDQSFELVASFRNMPLVIVGERELRDSQRLVTGLVVLGPGSELYQYYFDEISYSADPPTTTIALPAFTPADFVEFPENGTTEVAIRPVKDWLVFQAQLPNGRPLNLIFDSGAERMILDDLVLKVDSLLEPVGDLPVAGAFAMDTMQLYQGFSFEVGGVTFKDLDVIGTQLTTFGIGAETRIHGIVGNEILQLCQLDLDLEAGTMLLHPAAGDTHPTGTELELTFIEELPHITANVNHSGSALLMLDTGMGSPLAVNLDWLDEHELGDDLMMNGFMGDIAGGLMPRYLLENMDISLAGQNCEIMPVDASPDPTFTYGGMQVIGSIGFPMLSSHFGGVTFDYSRKRIYLRDPGRELVFAGQPAVWDAQHQSQFDQMSALGLNYTAPGFTPIDSAEAQAARDLAQVASAPPEVGPEPQTTISEEVEDQEQPVERSFSDTLLAGPDVGPPAEIAEPAPTESSELLDQTEHPLPEPTPQDEPQTNQTVDPGPEAQATEQPDLRPVRPAWDRLPAVSERPDPVIGMAHAIATALAASAFKLFPELFPRLIPSEELTETKAPEPSSEPENKPSSLFSEFTGR